MLIVAMKPGHDGAIAAIEDGRLLCSLEAEKDSFARYSVLSPDIILKFAAQLGRLPDVVATGGWQSKLEGRAEAFKVRSIFGAGYFGENALESRDSSFFGKRVRYFSSSHERSHILGAIGLAPRGNAPAAGSTCLGRHHRQLLPGRRLLPSRAHDSGAQPARRTIRGALRHLRPEVSGRRQVPCASATLASRWRWPRSRTQARPGRRLLTLWTGSCRLPTSSRYLNRSSPIRPCTTAALSQICGKSAAALLTDRIFAAFAEVARREIPPGLPLRISGGCGLNCDWNYQWRELGSFQRGLRAALSK